MCLQQQNFDDAVELINAFNSGLRPDPDMWVWEWADKNRVLTSKSSAEPGQYRTDRIPFTREIMEALSPQHPAQKVVVVKGTQLGLTEIGNNWLGFIMDVAPGPVLNVISTLELAKKNSKSRINDLINASPSLSTKLSTHLKDAESTILEKHFSGGVIVNAGANSASSLRSMPVRYLFMDEVSSYKDNIDDEGDPVEIATYRTDSFGFRKKIYMPSTPKVEGSCKITAEYETTDKRKYFVPCPCCGQYQTLEFKQLVFDPKKIENVKYKCVFKDCEELIDERSKTWMFAHGYWKATAIAVDKFAVGYHINSLYSPYGWLGWDAIARESVAANDNIEKKMAFTNSRLALAFKISGNVPDWRRIYEKAETWNAKIVPAGGLVVTATIDVQTGERHGRLEADVWAWGENLESWHIDHIEYHGDPTLNDVWNKALSLLDIKYKHELGGEIAIERVMVDSGDGNMMNTVYKWTTDNAPLTKAIKGLPAYNKNITVNGPKYVDIKENGQVVKRGGAVLYTVESNTYKAETYSFLRRDKPTKEELAKKGYPRGYIHLNTNVITEEWCKQLVSERYVAKPTKNKKNTIVWEAFRDRNEALDNRVYNRATYTSLGCERWSDAKWKRLKDELANVQNTTLADLVAGM